MSLIRNTYRTYRCKKTDSAPECQLLAALPAMAFSSRPNGAWDYVNPALCHYAGCAAEALTGLGWAAILHADDRPAALAQWQSALKSGTPLGAEHRLRSADGTYHWFHIQCAAQRSGAGAIIRWVGIATALPDDLQAGPAQCLRRAITQVRAEHSGVLSIVAHELRTPLTLLLGQAQLLQRRLHAGEAVEMREQLAATMIVEQTRRLSGLVSALFDSAQIDHGQLRIRTARVDLGVLVRRVAQDLQPILSSHPLEMRIAAQPLWVAGDALRLEQVLQNGLTNAAKYSPAGSEILVEVAAEGPQARVAVRDHGSGIAPDDQATLFQAFARAGAADAYPLPGLGLGLYICKAIMDQHGGSIALENNVDGGCTLSLLLPRLDCGHPRQRQG